MCSRILRKLFFANLHKSRRKKFSARLLRRLASEPLAVATAFSKCVEDFCRQDAKACIVNLPQLNIFSLCFSVLSSLILIALLSIDFISLGFRRLAFLPLRLSLFRVRTFLSIGLYLICFFY